MTFASGWSDQNWKFSAFMYTNAQTLYLDDYHEFDAGAVGQRSGMADGSGSSAWVYDARGRKVQETKVVNGTGGGTFVTQWGYNAADALAWRRYPGGNGGQAGETVSYTYHPQLSLNTVAGTNTYVSGTDYDAAGRVTLRKLGGGPVLQTSYTYYAWSTQGGRLQYLKSGTPGNPTSLQYFQYDYDAVGNLDWIKDYKAGGTQTQTFTYDNINRLRSANASGGSGGLYSESYTYDGASGNLASKTGMGTYTYNTIHKHAVATTSTGRSYQYDANGNMTQRVTGGSTYDLSYDVENRLTEVKKDGAVLATFVYDGDGQRVKGTVGFTTTVYLGDYFEWTGSTSTMKKYYYHGTTRVAMRQGSSTYYWLLGDHLGSTTVTANSSGAKSAEIRYKAWGEERYTWGATPTTFRYTGQRQEASLGGVAGLYYYKARWYDPELGRFIQADTLVPEPGKPLSWDRFAYVRNDPVRYTDPTGHKLDPGGDTWTPKSSAKKFDWPWGKEQSPDDNWIDLGFDWLLEHGPDERVFDESHYMTQMLMNHPGVNAARENFHNLYRRGEAPSSYHYYHDFGPDGYKAAWITLDGIGHLPLFMTAMAIRWTR